MLLASVPSGGADDLLQEIAARLKISERIGGRFEQSREVSFLSRPLRAKGTFSIDSSGALAWLVEEPVRSLMEVRGGVVSLDGRVVDDPGTGQFMAMILTAFMQRDLTPVAAQFSIAGESREQDWRLDLTPRNLLWRRVIAGVTLHGDAYLRTVTISETDGSATRIEFSDVVGEPKPSRDDDS
ncbi:MAG: outer membrane lipoprotein carrier protein LolA [Halioglobus sp.]|nr:outer membrane lipoprotein carrier protein LolA [Halioglobus sp.]